MSTDCDDTLMESIIQIKMILNCWRRKSRNRHDEGKIGGKRDNGESWCLYESPAGAFKDFPDHNIIELLLFW